MTSENRQIKSMFPQTRRHQNLIEQNKSLNDFITFTMCSMFDDQKTDKYFFMKWRNLSQKDKEAVLNHILRTKNSIYAPLLLIRLMYVLGCHISLDISKMNKELRSNILQQLYRIPEQRCQETNEIIFIVKNLLLL